MKMTIGRKLGFGFGLVLLLMVISGVVSYWTMVKVDKTSDEAITDLDTAMVLDERIGDHLRWVNSLADQFLLEKPFEGELDPHKCKFGHWYDTYKSDDPEITSILASIDEPHKKLHNSGATVKKIFEPADFSMAVRVVEAKTAHLEWLMALENSWQDAGGGGGKTI